MGDFEGFMEDYAMFEEFLGEFLAVCCESCSLMILERWPSLLRKLEAKRQVEPKGGQIIHQST